ISDLIQEANRRVYDRSSTDPNTSGMGTTITVALVEDGQVAFGHVGDSRAYLIRDGAMEQVTEDHSLVNELLKSGKLSPEEAESHPQRSVITRALGTDPDVDVDTFTIAAEAGDVFLLCSDGLTDMVGESEILELVERNRQDIGVARSDHDRRRNRTRSLPEVPALTLSPRNRELAFLIVVGVLTAVGFASVYIARQDVVSTASLTYAAFFFALYLAAHLATRYAVPFADPYLLPIAGLLTAIGLTEIYRLNPTDAFRQGIWIVVAVALFAATLFL